MGFVLFVIMCLKRNKAITSLRGPGGRGSGYKNHDFAYKNIVMYKNNYFMFLNNMICKKSLCFTYCSVLGSFVCFVCVFGFSCLLCSFVCLFCVCVFVCVWLFVRSFICLFCVFVCLCVCVCLLCFNTNTKY